MNDNSVTTSQQIFQFIVAYKREHDGLSPSISDIAAACFLHESTVRYHIARLEIQGRIRLVERRGIEVVGGAWEPPDGTEDDNAPM